jgi:chromosome segregation ATPase
MTISTYDIGRTFTDQARELDALDDTVSELRYDLDVLSEDQDTLRQQVFMLETDGIEPLRSRITDLEETTEEMRDGLTQTRTVVQRLVSQLAWLEHNVRTSAGLTAIVIDEASPTLQNLAHKAQLAATAQAGILPDMQRSRLQAQIKHYGNLHEQRQQYLATAVTHSKILTDCPDSGYEHSAASTAFHAALAQANQLAEQIISAQNAVSNAQARLAADDEYRRTHSATIAEGEQAKVVLHRKLRQRITDAIGNRALFPAWFTTALGYSPPADGTTEWVAVAAELVTYRITYAVNDQAVALGSRPAPGQAIQTAWFNNLTIMLRNQHQWPQGGH